MPSTIDRIYLKLPSLYPFTLLHLAPLRTSLVERRRIEETGRDSGGGDIGDLPFLLISGYDKILRMPRATSDAKLLIQSLGKAYAATPTNLKIIDLYVVFAVATALIQVVYMGIVGSFPFNSFLSGILSCIGTAVLAVCLRIQVNKDNKEFKDLPPERAFADFVLCNLVLHLVIMNFLG
ncbi:hypothetical protein ABZP36_006799 [Zizania latifolia]